MKEFQLQSTGWFFFGYGKKENRNLLPRLFVESNMKLTNSNVATLVSLLLLFFVSGNQLQAQPVAIKNADFNFDKKLEHAQVVVPGQWLANDQAREHARVWRTSSEATAVAIGGGAKLFQNITIPPLPEDIVKESERWDFILAIDVVGRYAKDSKPASLSAFICNRKDESLSSDVLARESFSVRNNADTEHDKLNVQRCFVIADAKKIKPSGDIQIQLSVDSMRFVVVDRVHLFFAPRKTTRKMQGKANGRLGPDFLAAGSYGFSALMVHQQPALPVIEVIQGSPADKAGLQSSDLIVGIDNRFLPPGDVAPGWNWFENSHEAMLGRAAIKAFERSSKRGNVTLQVLRDGKLKQLTIRLKFPFNIADPKLLTDEEKTQLLNQQLLGHIVNHQKPNGSWRDNTIHTSLGGLALLATRDPQHAKRIKSAANWILAKHAVPDQGFYWFPSFAGIFLSEYYLATGDERVLPTMERLLRSVEIGFHTSKWNTPALGHGPRGLPYGQKALVAPAVHVLVFTTLARECGIESNIWSKIEPYIMSAWSDPADGGHGGLGYNASYKDQAEFWSRSGLLLLHLNLRNERKEMQKPLAEIMRKRHPWIRNSHAYGEPGGALGLIGLHKYDHSVFHEVLKQYQWWFALALEPGYGLKFSTPHMGAPYMEGDVLINNGYSVVLQAAKQSLWITGAADRNWLDVSNIPVPVSAALVGRNQKGEVRIAGRIPGNEIRYTVDGSEPDKKSKRYVEPFSFSDGGIIKAAVFRGQEKGKTGVAEFSISKKHWTIESASGHTNTEEAKQRAVFAIDGDRRISWVTDVGETEVNYPHQVTINLGEPTSIRAARLHLMFAGGSPGLVRIEGAKSQDQKYITLAEKSFDQFNSPLEVDLGESHTIKWVRFVFDKPLQENQRLLMLGEIDLIKP